MLKRTLSVFILMFCVVNFASATSARYQKIELEDIEQLYIQGFIKVDVVQGQDSYLEIYMREGAINTLNIGKEIIANSTTLYIKELKNDQKEHTEKLPVAHVFVSLKALKKLKVHDGYRVSITGFTGRQLDFSSTGISAVEFNHIDIQQLRTNIQHHSIVKFTDVRSGTIRINQSSRSMLALERVTSSSAYVDLRAHSRFSAKQFNTGSFYGFSTYKTKIFMKQNSKIEGLNLKVSRESQVDLTQTNVSMATCDLVDEAIINLASVDILNVVAKNSAQLFYRGDPVLNIDKTSTSTVEKSGALAEGLLNE